MLGSIVVALALVAMLAWIVHQAPRQRTFVLAAAFVASGFWVVIAAGFRLHGQHAPARLEEGLVPALAVLIMTSAFGLRAMWRNRSALSASRIRTFSMKPSQEIVERLGWIERMKTDPRRRRYAELVEQGDNLWSPERVEYDLDSNATTCCAHLAPIEAAMRQAKVAVRMSSRGAADAECVIDEQALARDFSLRTSVKYEELVAYDRSLEDPPQARVSCDSCDSRIWVVHPSQARAGTARFP